MIRFEDLVEKVQASNPEADTELLEARVRLFGLRAQGSGAALWRALPRASARGRRPARRHEARRGRHRRRAVARHRRGHPDANRADPGAVRHRRRPRGRRGDQADAADPDRSRHPSRARSSPSTISTRTSSRRRNGRSSASGWSRLQRGAVHADRVRGSRPHARQPGGLELGQHRRESTQRPVYVIGFNVPTISAAQARRDPRGAPVARKRRCATALG